VTAFCRLSHLPAFGQHLVFSRHLFTFLAHLAQSAKVSFWDDPLSVVRRRRASSTIYLNVFFSETTDEKVIKLGTDVP